MATTSKLRNALPALLTEYDIRSILDIPCGDAFWISQSLPQGVDYIGADIVPSLIAVNSAEKSSLGRFEVLDLVSSPPPRGYLVMVRDRLIHLPNEMAVQALANVKKSGAKYILTTTYPGRADSIEIDVGGYRQVDLEATPFNLSEPLEIVLETEGVLSGKSIALWSSAHL